MVHVTFDERTRATATSVSVTCHAGTVKNKRGDRRRRRVQVARHTTAGHANRPVGRKGVGESERAKIRERERGGRRASYYFCYFVIIAVIVVVVERGERTIYSTTHAHTVWRTRTRVFFKNCSHLVATGASTPLQQSARASRPDRRSRGARVLCDSSRVIDRFSLFTAQVDLCGVVRLADPGETLRFCIRSISKFVFVKDFVCFARRSSLRHTIVSSLVDTIVRPRAIRAVAGDSAVIDYRTRQVSVPDVRCDVCLNLISTRIKHDVIVVY